MWSGPNSPSQRSKYTNRVVYMIRTQLTFTEVQIYQQGFICDLDPTHLHRGPNIPTWFYLWFGPNSPSQESKYTNRVAKYVIWIQLTFTEVQIYYRQGFMCDLDPPHLHRGPNILPTGLWSGPNSPLQRSKYTNRILNVIWTQLTFTEVQIYQQDFICDLDLTHLHRGPNILTGLQNMWSGPNSTLQRS